MSTSEMICSVEFTLFCTKVTGGIRYRNLKIKQLMTYSFIIINRQILTYPASVAGFWQVS